MTQSSTAPVWFITGTSSGVGRELALAALGRGDRVAATARNTDALADLVTRYPDQGLALTLDVREEHAAQIATKQTVEAFGRIDVVVNNAGYGVFGPVETSTDEQTRELFNTNVFGVLNVLRAVLPVLRQQHAGHVVQISSLFGHMSYPGSGVLAASKHAVGGFTEALAIELAPLGVRFTMIEPGAINTPFMSKIVLTDVIPDYHQTVGALLKSLSQIPPETLPSPTTIARAILKVVDAEQPPLHLALGAVAADEIRKALTSRLREMDDWTDATLEVDGPQRVS
jgi:NAD(P)-dependent dehydrogenase (short-subunit alcohol dehydrogenase family)